jgi:hypothetical protein
MRRHTCRPRLMCLLLVTVLAACGDDDASGKSGSSGVGGKTASSGAGGKTSSSNGGSGGTVAADAGTASNACESETSDLAKAICSAKAYLATLSASDLTTGKLEFSDSASRTKWSNLPGQARAGLKMGSLSATSQAAALALMGSVLSDAGVDDLTGVRAADSFLGAQQSSGGGMGMGGAGQYSSDNYYVAVFGTPSTTERWAITFGGHHMAYNITFLAGKGYPVPHHIGVEPKAQFMINSESYQPLSDEGAALVAVFKSLSESELASAYLTGTFADVLIGPVEYGTGSESAAKAKFPTGSNRTGVLASGLTNDQRTLIKTAIDAWVGDYSPAIADTLLADYTTDDAYADTYIAWGGTESAGVDVDVNGTYMRIDGPRLWIEVACQGGVVIQGKSHYHTIFRDKQYDYAGTL